MIGSPWTDPSRSVGRPTLLGGKLYFWQLVDGRLTATLAPMEDPPPRPYGRQTAMATHVLDAALARGKATA